MILENPKIVRFLKSENSKPKWNKGFLASNWATNNLASIVISNQFNAKTKPRMSFRAFQGELKGNRIQGKNKCEYNKKYGKC